MIFRLFIFSTFFSLSLSVNAQSILSLDGEWDILFDPQNVGREEGWIQDGIFNAQEDIQQISVPSAWELIKQDYEGVAFYRKEFVVPEEWENKVIRLQFGAVNYLSEIWLNGEVVGSNEGGFTPFEFRVDEMIKVGETNVLNIRVMGPIILTDQSIDGYGKLETSQWRGGITGGIWQSVNLVATGNTFIEDVYIRPDIQSGTATFQIKVNNTTIENHEVTLSINIDSDTDNSSSIAQSESWNIHPGENTQSWTIKIPDFTYWSPDNPHLYRASIKLIQGGLKLHDCSERFGMRELTIKDKDFYFNGAPIYIKATFFEGLYPKGIALPDSRAMIEREIRLAKEAGFNMIRPWRRPPAPLWLDVADEMGVLVVGSPALECMRLPLSTAYLPERVEHEIREAVLRDRNRACIVQWELFNELHRPVLNQLMRPMANLTRSLDPSRLILDESGGWAYGANMYLPNEYEPTKFNDIHNYPGPFIEEDRYDGYLSIGLTPDEKKEADYKGVTPGRNVVPGLMSFVSELGYGSLPDLTKVNEQFEKNGNPLTPAYRYHKRLDTEQRQMLLESGFSDLYPSMSQFYLDQQSIHGAANKRMIEAVRANPRVDGYCIHALSAGDWILGAGLIDLWRDPKSYAYQGTLEANQPQIVSIRVSPRNVYADEGASLEVIGINDLKSESVVVNIEISSKENNDVVYSKSKRTEYDLRVSQLYFDDLETKDLLGAYVVDVTIYSKYGKIISSNSFDFDVFPALERKVDQQKVALMDTSSRLRTHLEHSGYDVIHFTKADTNIPLLVSGKNHDGITQFIKDGGTAVFIEGVTKAMMEGDNVLPFKANVHPAKGLWTCIPHMVSDHPIFEGLPSETMMHNEYENVWPNTTLRDIEIEGNSNITTIGASIGFDWFSREHKMHYSGPGASWWGADVAEVEIGKGSFIISQLRLIENLGKDPVAEKILSNMLSYLQEKN